MTDLTQTAVPSARLLRNKSRVAAIRQRARSLFDAGTPGIQITAALCTALDELLLHLIDEAVADVCGTSRTPLETQGAVIAVGGTGRGELSPYSDVDLLFLDGGSGRGAFRDCAAHIVQSCWDATLGLGHSVRTLSECLAMARQDSQAATALIEARLIWGSAALFERLRRRFRKTIVDGRRRAFIDDCLAARAAEFPEPGVPAQELEPNVKRSLGGLRDMHLIRWIGFVLFGVCDLDSLRLKGALSMDESHAVRSAWEFLTRLRVDLHLAAGKAQDVLTRDEQLRIAEARGTRGTAGLRPVERFMQGYFQHSSGLAKVAQRFAARHRPRSAWSRVAAAVFSHRTDGMLRVAPDQLDAAPRHLSRLCRDVESVLRLYRTAALYGVLPSPRLIDAIETAVAGFGEELSSEAARLFLDVLRCTTHLGPVLRSMYDTGLLELLVPDLRHARCLMQFNQYHHYTVDEHSLRAVEVATRLAERDGEVGAVYASLRHKEVLHLALLLHDLGKGFDEHHWEVGRRIAERTARRLALPPPQREQLVFLVHQHLEMSHLALRRDISDADLVLQFSHKVGIPETLNMLYVLTAADITAVGPEAWTTWKGDLLTELYHRSRQILSGMPDDVRTEERLQRLRDRVLAALAELDPSSARPPGNYWVERQLGGLPDYYLSTTAPARIAADLNVIHRLAEDEVSAQARYDADTHTVEYRIITRSRAAAEGCFHKLAGVLTAKRLEILSADISTTREGAIIDSFRVVDPDFRGAVARDRLDDVCRSLADVLRNRLAVESLFQRHRRFAGTARRALLSNLPIRVELDNDSSDSRTIIDVFAHDRPGLLYSVSRAIYELGLSVDLARISTHYDQVVDVFYVREANGRKVTGADRLQEIRSRLIETLEHFERDDERRIVG